jgi:hypothetical protein
MARSELERLLVQKWSDLDAAGAMAGVLEAAVFDAIDALIKDWAGQSGWIVGKAAGAGTWFLPEEWRSGTTNQAWFQWSWVGADEECWELTSLIGAGNGRAGLQLKSLGSAIPKSALTDPALIEQLPGFSYETGVGLFLPIALSRDALAEAGSEGADMVVREPMQQAFTVLERSRTVLGGLIKKAL